MSMRRASIKPWVKKLDFDELSKAEQRIFYRVTAFALLLMLVFVIGVQCGLSKGLALGRQQGMVAMSHGGK